MIRLLAITLTTLLMLACASSAQAVERPFQAASSGTLVGGTVPRYVCEGEGTHLGQFSKTLILRRGVIPRSFFPGLGDLSDFPHLRMGGVVFFAADGSVLQGTILYDSFDPESLSAFAEISITEGTGRFEQATGAIDVLLLFTSDTLVECDILMDGTLDY